MGYTSYSDGAGGGPVLVQRVVATGTSAAPAATLAATAAGSTLVAKVAYANAGGTLTMPAGFAEDVGLAPVGPHVSLWSRPGAAAGTTAVTGSLSGGSARWVMALEEWSGLLTASPLDATASATTTTGSAGGTGTTAATSQASEMAASAVAVDDGSNGDGEFSAPANGFTLLENKANGSPLALATLSKVLSSTGAQSTAVSCSTNPNFFGVIATYRASGPHAVSASGGPLWVSNGTAVSFAGGITRTGDGSALCPPESALHGLLGDTGTLSGTDLTLAGGGDVPGRTAGHGLLSYGQSWSFGGTLTGRGGAGLYCAGHGLVFADPAAWSLGGLDARGGDSPGGIAGAGLVLYLGGAGAVTSLALPAASAYAAGSGATANAALALELHSSCAVTVPGGTFSGYVALDLADTSSVVFQGSGLSWSGGSLVTDGTGTLSGTVGGHVVSLTVLCTGATLSASGSGSAVTFAP